MGAESDGVVGTRLSDPAALANELQGLFIAFAKAYTAAIGGDSQKTGVAAEEIQDQYIAYGRLLEAVTLKAKGDRLRDMLLKPLLAIGIVPVVGAAPAAIVAPWNPLRMRAMCAKAERLAALVRHLLDAPSDLVWGSCAVLQRDERRRGLQHPYYPELAIGWRERKAELPEHN